MEIKVSLSGDALQRLPESAGMLRYALLRSARSIAARGIAAMRDSDDMPRWTGNMSDGMRAIPTDDGAMLLVPAEYAGFVHDGRDPTPGALPNIDNLADWARDHNMKGAEWAIAAKISRDGIKGRPFMKNYIDSPGFSRMAAGVINREVTDAMG